MLTVVFVGFLVAALICGLLTGNIEQVSAAVSEGASQAITLCLGITGIMCFWSGMMEVMRQAGLADWLARRLRPLLRPLFGCAAEDPKTAELLSANISANLLGLSNAATPLGLDAGKRMYAMEGRCGAPDSVLTLITLNTASIQLIPNTVAAIRASCGAVQPYDIMPAVWGASAASVAVVLLCGRLLRPLFPNRIGS